MVRIACIGVGCKDGHLFRSAVDRLSSEGYDIQLFVEESVALDNDLNRLQSFLRTVSTCDICFLQVHGDFQHFRHYQNLIDVIRRGPCHGFLTSTEVTDVAEYRYLFPLSDDDFNLLRRLEEAGGDDNMRSMMLWVLRTYGDADVDIPEPVIPVQQGVFIPGEGYRGLDEAFREVGRSGRPVVCVLFHQKYFLVHNTAPVELICGELESFGTEAVAVFTSSHPNDLTGSIGISGVVDRYLIRDGQPVVDCVVNTMGFSQTLIADPGNGNQKPLDDFFSRLDVPVIQAITLYGSPKRWSDSAAGLSPADIVMSVTDPEYDGQIDSFPVSGSELGEDGLFRSVAIPDRCRAVAEMAFRWARLRHLKESEKKVAVIMYMYPPRQDLAGGGYGLDTYASVTSLLKKLKADGYRVDWIPDNPQELADRMASGVTNDDGAMSDDLIRRESVDFVSKRDYETWLSEIPAMPRDRMLESWGPAPGDVHVLGDRQLLPGVMNGNIFLCFQPDRGKCIDSKSYHDAWSAPPHQYLGFYRWLKYKWHADAVIHVGTHGTLEWLPGKSAGLSSECYPDMILGSLPNINPYIIDNPGEGMQAKRRSYAVITTHLPPAMARSGGYETINELESALQLYLKAANGSVNESLPVILGKIRELAVSMNMHTDMGFDPACSNEDLAVLVDDMYDYVLEVKDAFIKDGLHILGDVPEGTRMCETISMLTRYPNGDVPSLREAVARFHGLDFCAMSADPSGVLPDGRLNGEAADSIDAEAYSLVESFVSSGFDADSAATIVSERYPGSEEVRVVAEYICGPLASSVIRMTDEIDNISAALDGRFVPPGPSGCPTRGRADILPTGRNFYSIDPDGVPWHSSWELGSKMAEQMVSRYVEENGVYPHDVGVVLWATDTMKTGGDDVSYILRLMGLRPVWTGYGGRVKDLEVIPLSELGRPRIDVTLRISGLFRDTFPNLCEIIDQGARRIMELDEDDESNYLAANLRHDTVEAISAGIPADVARMEAGIRVFGDAPGTYGCGVSDMVQTSKWQNVGDIADEYVKRGCYVYGKGLQGESKPELFRRRLKVMDVTVKNHNTRAVDMLDMDDDFDCLGGFNAAVTAVRGESPVSFMGDSSDTRNPKLRTTAEECRFIFRSKLDNPKWVEGLKKHGWAGAKELSKLFDYTMGWSATSGIIEDWMWEDLANRYVLDEGVKEWIKDDNPYAMQAMINRLEEAISRGLWNASDEMKEKLAQVYLEFEDRIEEITDR